MQMSYGASTKLESITGFGKSTKPPTNPEMLIHSLLVKAKTQKKENVIVKGKTMWKNCPAERQIQYLCELPSF